MWFILSESAKENVRWSFMKYVGLVLLASDEVKSEVWRIKTLADDGRRRLKCFPRASALSNLARLRRRSRERRGRMDVRHVDTTRLPGPRRGGGGGGHTFCSCLNGVTAREGGPFGCTRGPPRPPRLRTTLKEGKLQIKPFKDCCGDGVGSKGFRLIVDYSPTDTQATGRKYVGAEKGQSAVRLAR